MGAYMGGSASSAPLASLPKTAQKNCTEFIAEAVMTSFPVHVQVQVSTYIIHIIQGHGHATHGHVCMCASAHACSCACAFMCTCVHLRAFVHAQPMQAIILACGLAQDSGHVTAEKCAAHHMQK